MNNRKTFLTKLWLSLWLYVITFISGVIVAATFCHWTSWNLQTKLTALTVAMLPIHVLEEWHFPGGFHTMYNYLAGSEKIHYSNFPMNQLSDMWTNFIGVIVGCIILIIGVNPCTAIMQMMLGFGECMAHTVSGIKIHRALRSKGKRTIYNPGLFTALLGYLPLSLGILYSLFAEAQPSVWQIIIAIALGMILMIVSLPLAEKLCKNKDTPYGFDWGDGYFKKYLD